MAENKRKTRDGTNSRKKNNKKGRKDEKKGPRLPNSLIRELDSVNPNPIDTDNSDVEEDLHGNDFYEYDEPTPEEETHKNRRFDQVDNLEYQLPDKFEDENLPSDDEDDDVAASENKGHGDDSDQSEDDTEEDNDGKHRRMLQGITGMPAEAFEGKKKKFVVVSEAYPESEYNPSQSALDGDGHISIQDLLDPLQKKHGYSELRKRIHKLETKSMSVQTPLSKVARENVERGVAYEISKKDITKWEPLVKRNREAPTIFFDEDTDIGFSTVGAMASDFKPRSEFEKKIDAIVHDAKIVEAHKEDGARLLELNKISIEDVKDRQNRLAKMRSLLFWHERKAKHAKSIKSKTYRRLQKKDKMKAAHSETGRDPESAKEQAMKQEFKRAEERMRLKHKNKSKWAKRMIELGLNTRDEGTRVAIAEQLHEHARLTRKMNTMTNSSSSDESSEEDDDDEFSPGTEEDGASKLLTSAKEKTINLMEQEDEIPTSGVLSLPFMVRGMKKRKEEANAEAKRAIEEYEFSLNQLQDKNEAETSKIGSSSGRRVFGAAGKQREGSENRIKANNINKNSDSEDDYKANDNVEYTENSTLQKGVHVDANTLREESDIGRESLFKSFDDTSKDPGPKTTYDVAIFASNSRKKIGSKDVTKKKDRESPAVVKPALPHQNVEEVDDDGSAESEEELMDGILSSGTKPSYELPSQEDLIHLAFAGDDVEEEFEKDKMEILNEENPEPEKPVLVPGWGQWTHIQKKKGMPSWMLEEHENAKRKREESLKNRKDAHLKHVIISEKINKKAEKLHTKTLPFPFTSKEVFERSIRVPIGPEFNPATSVGALIRPEVVKKPGVIIKPIKYEDVNPYDKEDGYKSKGQTQETKKHKNSSGKGTKKMKMKQKS